jgi:hypothetical protein
VREGGKAQAVESLIRRNGNIGVYSWHEGSSAMLWSCDTSTNSVSDVSSKEVCVIFIKDMLLLHACCLRSQAMKRVASDHCQYLKIVPSVHIFDDHRADPST